MMKPSIHHPLLMKKLFFLSTLCCLALVSCAGLSSEDKILEVKSYGQIMKTGKDTPDPIHGKEVGFYYGAVSGTTEGRNANGIGYIHVYEDGTSVITVNLNIELPTSGTYKAYLGNNSDNTSILIGELESIVGDVRHTIKSKTRENVGETLVVKVLLEERGKSTLVAEGVLKQPTKAE